MEDNLGCLSEGTGTGQVLARSTAAARNALDLAVKQYRQGARDFTAVLIAQQSLLNEQDNLAIALGSISSGSVGVDRSLVGLWLCLRARIWCPGC